MSVDAREVVLITGASTGIGLALCKLLHRHARYRIVATARLSSMHRFEEAGLTADTHLMLHPLDVTIPSERERLMDSIRSRWGAVDVLVNNAGVCFRGVVEHLSSIDQIRQMEVNFFAPLELSRMVIPGMRQQRSGSIINISSVGGMMAMPTMGAYSASKFALEGATEALFYEMKPWNVRVVLLEPGFIHSKSFQHSLFTDAAQAAQNNINDPYYKYYYYLNKLIARGMRVSRATPESIAKRIVKVMHSSSSHFRIPATIDAWVFRLARKLLPRGLYHSLLYANLPHVHDWANVGTIPDQTPLKNSMLTDIGPYS